METTAKPLTVDDLENIRKIFEGSADWYSIERLFGHIAWQDKQIDDLDASVTSLKVQRLDAVNRADNAEADVAVVRSDLEHILRQLTNPPGRFDASYIADLVRYALDALQQHAGTKLHSDMKEIRRIIEEFEASSPGMSRYGGLSVSEHVHLIIRNYNRIAANSVSGQKNFQNDMVTHLKAISLVVDMIGNASTHAEKGARLRGLSELIETTIRKLQEKRVEFGYSWYGWDDVFASDYPVRHYIDQIRQLEREKQELQNQLGATRAEGVDGEDRYS